MLLSKGSDYRRLCPPLLLQQESREVGLVERGIKQILIISYVKKNHPDLIALIANTNKNQY
jgi:hypothetical protein